MANKKLAENTFYMHPYFVNDITPLSPFTSHYNYMISVLSTIKLKGISQ